MTSQPDVSPIRAAFEKAGLGATAPAPAAPVSPDAAAPVDKKSSKRKAEKDAARAEDAGSILRTAKSRGEHAAYSVGRAYGWSDRAIGKLLKPPEPEPSSSPVDGSDSPSADAKPPASAGGASGGEGGSGGASGGGWVTAKDPVKPLPAGCPVKPLGVNGNTFFYLDPLNELRDLADKDHSAMGLRGLFKHRIDALWKGWPKFRVDMNQDGWKADRAAESLMAACGARGVYDAFGRVRGLGAWTDEAGRLVFHAGDAVFADGEWRAPGEYGLYLYPSYVAGPRPADDASEHRERFRETLSIFDTWTWIGDKDAETGDVLHAEAFGHTLQSVLLFGWLGTAIIGGALKWRSLIWLTGDAGSGKSTLLQMIMDIIGDAVKSADATPAGVYSTLKNSTRAVLLDEVENDPDSPRTRKLVELARKAASGDMILRGSSDHQAAAFDCRSSFLFSSIIIPPMLSQDVSRFAILDLGAIDGDRPAFTADPLRSAAVGRLIRRRIVDGWARWPAALEAWRGSLAAVGHSARGCDQFGGPLAMADLLLYNETADPDTRAEIVEHFRAHADNAKASSSSNAGAMLNYLITLPIDAFRGGTKHTVGELIASATLTEDDKGIGTPQTCEDVLRTWGIFVKRDPRDFKWNVTLPNYHEGLRRLFEGSQWRASPGTAGGWSQAMRRLQHAREVNSRAIGGRGWSVPIDIFLLREGGNG